MDGLYANTAHPDIYMVPMNQNQRLQFLHLPSISFVTVWWFYLREHTHMGGRHANKGKKNAWQVSMQIHFLQIYSWVTLRCSHVHCLVFRRKASAVQWRVAVDSQQIQVTQVCGCQTSLTAVINLRLTL